MITPIQFAEPFGPSKCRAERKSNLELARFASRSPLCADISKQSLARARYWHRLVMQGGNDTYHYQVKHGITKAELRS